MGRSFTRPIPAARLGRSKSLLQKSSDATPLPGDNRGNWWDLLLVRGIFVGVNVAACYHFRPFGLSPLNAGLAGLAFSFAVILFEIRLQRASLRRLMGAAVGSILGMLGAYLMNLVLAHTSIPVSSRSFLGVAQIGRAHV